jgi:K+-sensing histidine kinase KdpD
LSENGIHKKKTFPADNIIDTLLKLSGNPVGEDISMNDAKKVGLKNTKAEETLALLKPFICRCLNIYHDLNNHLTGIIGYTEFLLEENEPLSGNQREYIRQIMICAERIEKEIIALCDDKKELSGKINIKQLFPDD